MLCKFVTAAVVAAFLIDQGNRPSESKATEAKPKETAVAPKDSSTEKSETPRKSTDEKAFQQKPASTKPAGLRQDLHEVEKQIVEKTNAQRVRYGLPPLVVDRNLIQSARTHAAWMTNSRSLQHTNRPVAENIAMGQRTTDVALNSWMNSSGHRANILSTGHRRIGVAAYRTPEGTIFWCQQFLP
jgi:uncharacterized protein YkwD